MATLAFITNFRGRESWDHATLVGSALRQRTRGEEEEEGRGGEWFGLRERGGSKEKKERERERESEMQFLSIHPAGGLVPTTCARLSDF